MSNVDDFSNLPLDDIAEQMTVKPTEGEAKEAKFRDVLAKVPAVPLQLGKGKAMAAGIAKAKPIDVIAETVGVAPAEVKQMAKAMQNLAPSEQVDFHKALADTSKHGSIFDLDFQMQKLFNDVKDVFSGLDTESELKHGYAAELRQLLKLAKDYMRDAEFIKKLKAEHDEELALVLEAFNGIDPATAAALFKKIDELRARRRILKGG